MNRKAFIIVLDQGGILDLFNYAQFHRRLILTKGIIDWWHHLPSTHIVIVDWNVNATRITSVLMKLAPNKKFFVCELNLDDNNGFLPPQAWEWIKKYKN